MFTRGTIWILTHGQVATLALQQRSSEARAVLEKELCDLRMAKVSSKARSLASSWMQSVDSQVSLAREAGMGSGSLWLCDPLSNPPGRLGLRPKMRDPLQSGTPPLKINRGFAGPN